MKKLISIMLCLMLVVSMATVAFAAENETSDGVAASEAKTFNFKKTYVTTAGQTPATYPAETLKFTVSADTANPDGTMISVADHPVAGNPDNAIVITIPSYKLVGKYNYTVSETAGNTQGVGYSTNSFGVQVMAYYNDDHTAIETQVAFTSTDGEGGKIDGIKNIYDLGNLKVTKTVSGNLASTTKKFDIKVTFTATGDVLSSITYGTNTIDPSDWKDDGTAEVTISLAHNEYVEFKNIPANVTYTVVEDSKHTTGDVNGEEGYAATYDYTGDKTIAADETENATVKNEKNSDVDTGITLDSVPFVLILAVCAVAVVLFVTKRRRVEF